MQRSWTLNNSKRCCLLGFYSKSFHSIIDGVAVKMGYNQPKYVVVIDAGSSGSRVNAFEFYNGYFEDRLILNKKLFVKTKPGISFYHAEPNKVCYIHLLSCIQT